MLQRLISIPEGSETRGSAWKREDRLHKRQSPEITSMCHGLSTRIPICLARKFSLKGEVSRYVDSPIVGAISDMNASRHFSRFFEGFLSQE